MNYTRFSLPPAEGLDPFDALRSPRIPPWVRRSARGRQIAIQLRKRLPWDLSTILRIEPFVMAKTLGCHLTALTRASCALGESDVEAATGIVHALDEVQGNLGDGAWGYEFDVQTRWAYYPVGSSNLIATAFVGRALASAGLAFGRKEWCDAAALTAAFALSRLARPVGDDDIAFFYTNDAKHMVHNANLLGAALCADAAAAGFDQGRSAALRAATVAVRAQQPDGSWPYGDTASLAWIDSFHTAYNLDGLLQVWLLTGDEQVHQSLVNGARYWVSHFFGPQGEPYYYHDGSGAYDIHSATTAVDIGSRLATWGIVDEEVPRRVAEWTAANLVDPHTGATYYRRNRFRVDRRTFPRWGDAHWALARASLLLLDHGARDPLEAAVFGARL